MEFLRLIFSETRSLIFSSSSFLSRYDESFIRNQSRLWHYMKFFLVPIFLPIRISTVIISYNSLLETSKNSVWKFGSKNWKHPSKSYYIAWLRFNYPSPPLLPVFSIRSNCSLSKLSLAGNEASLPQNVHSHSVEPNRKEKLVARPEP